MSESPRLGCAFTHFCTGRGLSHIFLSVCRGLGAGLNARLIVPACAPEYRDRPLIEAVPRALQKLVFRSPDAARILTERRLLREAARCQAVYLFPAVSLSTVKRLRTIGATIFLERVNCAVQTAAAILDEAYRRLGYAPAHGITTETIEREREEISHVNYVVCPSPNVYSSFVRFGVPEAKLIRSSYGWSPQRFAGRSACASGGGRFTVLFVGYICVRKGAHLLLDAWARAGLDGQLILCGAIEPAIAKTCGHLLSRDDVVHVPFTHDVGPLYSRADLFAFPSLEEGGPLVTPEAMAHGLPVLTSPMGAGSFVRDGLEGRVLEPYDADGWVDALRDAIGSPDRYARYGVAGQQRAQAFTWERISASRGEAIKARVSTGLFTDAV